MRPWTCTAVAVAILSSGGCASLDLESLAGAVGSGNQVRGEIERIDERRREIDIRSDTRQQTTVHYDARTEITYRNREYPLSSLADGDRVTVRVERTGRGDLYAQTVVLEETARDRSGNSGGPGRVEQFDGRVASVEVDRGRFTLQATRASYLVTLPYDASPTTVDRFNRLRAGDSIRIEGELLNNGRIELHRFR
jgi:hypothetical protein